MSAEIAVSRTGPDDDPSYEIGRWSDEDRDLVTVMVLTEEQALELFEALRWVLQGVGRRVLRDGAG